MRHHPFNRNFRKHIPGNRFSGGRFSRGKGRNIKSSVHASQYVNKSQILDNKKAVEITHKFVDFAIDPRLKQNILNHGYTIPTPIQDQAIQPILDGRDVVGIANTGTGKTAAFLIPLINKILLNRNEKVLIIIPTRELAVQIKADLDAFSKSLQISSALCIGGSNIMMQIRQIQGNAHFTIGTPGRLKDLINRRVLNLSNYKNIVLDEVDRMVDIGFIKDIKFIISHLPRVRQSLFFSATVSQEINGIIQTFLTNPITISVKVYETAKNIDQDIVRVTDNNDKVFKLQSMLKNRGEFKKVLVFGRTKHGVEKLSKLLLLNGFSAASIHGNKSQNQRLRALNAFKQNLLQVLVATDVAARGLDIENVSHVINFDEPTSYNDYIHRIGRTGRADKMGKALTFVS